VTNDPQAAGFVVAWLYRPRPERRAEFERVYGPDGAWAALFRRGEGYLGTELFGDGESYLVLDRWGSRDAHDRFGRAFEAEYAALSAESERLYIEETRLGAFGLVSVSGGETSRFPRTPSTGPLSRTGRSPGP
jgi:heme-degrading monooxygenase HmoA